MNEVEEYKKQRYHCTNEVLIPKMEFDNNMSKDDICEKFRNTINDYYGLDHVVDFDKIEKTRDDLYLGYRFTLTDVSDESIYGKLYILADNYHQFQEIVDAPLIGPKPYDELLELADIYELQIKRESDIECDKIMDTCKKYLKFTARKKIKQLLNLDKDGNFVDVEQINYKLSIINKFNKDKYNHTRSYLKKNGKTIHNFSLINNEWDKKNNKESLELGRMSDELKIDMATSGYNDKLV